MQCQYFCNRMNVMNQCALVSSVSTHNQMYCMEVMQVDVPNTWLLGRDNAAFGSLDPKNWLAAPPQPAYLCTWCTGCQDAFIKWTRWCSCFFRAQDDCAVAERHDQLACLYVLDTQFSRTSHNEGMTLDRSIEGHFWEAQVRDSILTII